jgi:hypothetical protein
MTAQELAEAGYKFSEVDAWLGYCYWQVHMPDGSRFAASVIGPDGLTECLQIASEHYSEQQMGSERRWQAPW